MKKINFKISHLYKNGRLFGFGVSPSADWKILFSVFLILILFVASLGAYVFWGIANGNIFVVDKPFVLEDKTLDYEQLKKTISYYEERAQKLESIKSNRKQFADPSI